MTDPEQSDPSAARPSGDPPPEAGPGASAGTDTHDADGDETLADLALDADDDPGKGGD
jgi:hypothetical protein